MRQSRLNGNTKRAVFVFIIYRKHTKLIIHVHGGGDLGNRWRHDFQLCKMFQGSLIGACNFFSEVNTAFIFRVNKIVGSVAFRLLTQYCADDKIEKNEMGWACSAYG